MQPLSPLRHCSPIRLLGWKLTTIKANPNFVQSTVVSNKVGMGFFLLVSSQCQPHFIWGTQFQVSFALFVCNLSNIHELLEFNRFLACFFDYFHWLVNLFLEYSLPPCLPPCLPASSPTPPFPGLFFTNQWRKMTMFRKIIKLTRLNHSEILFIVGSPAEFYHYHYSDYSFSKFYSLGRKILLCLTTEL